MPNSPSWRGTDRYEVRRRIGEGGMGVVYEAYDHERQELVALKTLLRFSPTNLYRFKQEFRTLADAVHPNLVRFHELEASGAETVFFTMELVRGTTFRGYVRAGDTADQADFGAPTAQGGNAIPLESGALAREGSRFEGQVDVDRLRSAFRQLAEGVHALHLAGKLHRDIKPSNVLVTDEGRVVILDFGVATELGGADGGGAESQLMVGTVTYMAPEQATGGPPTAASDWYSVGVMLFEALLGRLPFAGSSADVLALKTTMAPPSPSEFADGIPEDLDALCCDLLRREAAQRPSGEEVIRRLRGSGAPPRATPLPAAWTPGDMTLVGREPHLATLREAFDATCAGRTITLLVHGSSGMGRSALVSAFLEPLVQGGHAVALRGRVYERESVPYRTFDGVVDSLRRRLVELEERARSIVSPADVSALARLFPVLRGVATPDAFAEWTTAGPQEVRLRGFLALRSLLGSFARQGPLVVFVDDVHWGDMDSIGLLFEAVRPPSAPPMLVVLSYQDEAASLSPFLREVRARWPGGAEMRELTVGPLEPQEATTLSGTLLAQRGDASLQDAETIGRESRGSPFLIEELVRSASGHEALRNGQEPAARGALTLDAMVSHRLSRLDATARHFLELVAVAGRPLEASAIGDAAGVREWADVTHQLQARRFVRTGLRAGQEVVEISHGRIADTILSCLGRPTVSEHHRRLARTLLSRPIADAEAVAQHLLGAGERREAADWVERAADQAADNLAFDQAIRLYRLAIDLCREVDPASARVDALRMRLGEVDACLSSADLEGALKQQVEELMRTQAEVEEAERRVKSLAERMEGYRQRMAELREQLGAASAAAHERGSIRDLQRELGELKLRLSMAVTDADATGARLRSARVKLQQGVADLSLVEDPAPGK